MFQANRLLAVITSSALVFSAFIALPLTASAASAEENVQTVGAAVEKDYAVNAQVSEEQSVSADPVKFTASSYTVGAGESLKVTGDFSEAQKPVFKTSDKNVVIIDSNGTISAKATGTAYITVTTGKQSNSSKVTVRKAPSYVKLSSESLKMGVGETLTISESTGSETYANAANLIWTSSSDIVSITGKNKNKVTFKAEAVGTADLKIKLYNGKEAVCNITVLPAPQNVSVKPDSIKLSAGVSYTISESTNSGTYANASNLKWSSSNSAVATVTKANANKAVIKALKQGTANVTITLYNGVKAACRVEVTEPVRGVTINTHRLKMGKGEIYTFVQKSSSGTANPKDLSWSISNSTVATLTKNEGKNTAVIKAKTNGFATVTLKYSDGTKSYCYVTVGKAPNSINFSSNNITMLVGEDINYYSYVNNNSFTCQKIYSSSDSSVLKISSGGSSKALKAGKAVLTAKTQNGTTGKCTVTVKKQNETVKKTTIAATTLRTDASWASSSKGNVPKGSVVYQYGTSDDKRWYKVKYGNKYGWLYNLAFKTSANYSSMTLTTLPAICDDELFTTGTSIRPIFDYVKRNVIYRNEDNASIEGLALFAFRYNRGSCYHRAGLLYYMLSRCGYEMQFVKGDDELTGNDHNWCMIKLDSGWRHIDATRVITYSMTLPEYYLVKDSSLKYFTWNRKAYPEAN